MVIIPVHYTGPGATPQNVTAIIDQINTLNTNGSPVGLQVIATDKPMNGVLNEMDLSPGLDFKNYPTAGEGAVFGGNKAHIDSSAGLATGAAAHDSLHFVGIEDQYQEGPHDAQGNRTASPKPGYDDSNIMVSRSGTAIKPVQIQEAKQNRTTKQCTIENGKTVCN